MYISNSLRAYIFLFLVSVPTSLSSPLILSTSSCGWNSIGCYGDVPGRVLGTAMVVAGGPAAMTIEACTTACQAAGFSLAGIEWAQECYCGSTIRNGAPIADAACHMACLGNSDETCGGDWALNVYSYGGACSTTTSVSSSTSMSTSTTTDTSGASSTTTSLSAPTSTAISTSTSITTTLTSSGMPTAPALANCVTSALTCTASPLQNGGFESTANNGAPWTSKTTSQEPAGDSMSQIGGPSFSIATSNGFERYGNSYAGLGIYEGFVNAAYKADVSISQQMDSLCPGVPYVFSGNYIVWHPANGFDYTIVVSINDGVQQVQIASYSTPVLGNTYPVWPAMSGTFVPATSSVSITITVAIVPGPGKVSTSYADYLSIFIDNLAIVADDAQVANAIAAATKVTCTSAWSRLGCYTDSVSARSLNVYMPISAGAGALTTALCTAACEAAGFHLAGTEYSDECYCGNSLYNDGALASDGEALCNMDCAGDSDEICGGPNRLSLYAFGGSSALAKAPTWSSVGCTTDSVAARTLPRAMNVAGGPISMTVESCKAACYAEGYTYAGVEFASECYCGNTLLNGGGPAPDGEALCNMPCQGNTAEMCGGPNRLSLFKTGRTSTRRDRVVGGRVWR